MENISKTGTWEDLSELNRSQVIQFLHRNGASSRAQIASALGLTPSAVTKIVARLLELGIVRESGLMSGKLNRRSYGLELNTSGYLFLGVKFSRATVSLGLFDLGGQMKAFEEQPLDFEDVISAVAGIKALINGFLSRGFQVTAIGISVPGPFFKKTGRLGIISGTIQWRGVNFTEEFAHAFPVPCFIERDSPTGVLAHYLFDNPTDSACLAYFQLGNGVGVGVMDQRRIISGFQGVGAELGHLSIDVNGPVCVCGNHGCLELYCSARAVRDLLLKEYPHLIADAGHLSSREVCNKLFQMGFVGDPTANAVIDRVGAYVGYGCVATINMYNPEEIILGDIVAGAGERLLAAAQRIVEQRVQPEISRCVRIRFSRLNSDPCLIGAAALAVQEFLKFPTQLT